MKTTIKPIGKNVLIKPDAEQSRESNNGIITPDSVDKEKPSKGTVLAVGSDVKYIKKGDRCVYGMYSGEKIEEDKVEYILVQEEFILATL